MTKIYFQSLNIDHANILFEYLQEDALYHYIPDQKYTSIQALKQRYSRLIQGSASIEEIWLNWVMFSDTQLKQPIGTLQATLFPQQETAQIGYVIFKPFWGLGYASKAVEWLENDLKHTFSIQNLEAYVDPKNTASIKVLEKNNFIFKTVEEDDLYYSKSISQSISRG
ncbi:GNAT family N-acetyltransferase [Acinetobacter sp. P8-3-8]|uniref:GNAT family N-acetyltransferase n=1 Tax=Acinetobacter sp. P8-3-8 TaxID=1029823 RepID=UPI0002485CFC|nr:GNAT family N-acetyltransferase [Acinetobacter sp. P8-3-8]